MPLTLNPLNPKPVEIDTVSKDYCCAKFQVTPIRGFRFIMLTQYTHTHNIHHDKVITISAPAYCAVSANNKRLSVPAQHCTVHTLQLFVSSSSSTDCSVPTNPIAYMPEFARHNFVPWPGFKPGPVPLIRPAKHVLSPVVAHATTMLSGQLVVKVPATNRKAAADSHRSWNVHSTVDTVQ